TASHVGRCCVRGRCSYLLRPCACHSCNRGRLGRASHYSFAFALSLEEQIRRPKVKLIKSIIRPDKLEQVKETLTQFNVTGMTVTEVRGHGRQKGHKAIYRGTEYSVTLLPKVMLEVVVPDERAEEVITTIMSTARTGEIGDGRIFVLDVGDGYNVRTG